jgi:hypothetical protein
MLVIFAVAVSVFAQTPRNRRAEDEAQPPVVTPAYGPKIGSS